jgi:hypothetical protein
MRFVDFVRRKSSKQKVKNEDRDYNREYSRIWSGRSTEGTAMGGGGTFEYRRNGFGRATNGGAKTFNPRPTPYGIRECSVVLQRLNIEDFR